MESDTLLEGRAALFTVEIEKKMIAKLQQFKNQITSAQQEKEENLNSLLEKI